MASRCFDTATTTSEHNIIDVAMVTRFSWWLLGIGREKGRRTFGSGKKKATRLDGPKWSDRRRPRSFYPWPALGPW
jgi:hypothetical protein